MPILTYRDAVSNLNVSMAFFRQIIDRHDFSEFRITRIFKDEKKLKNGRVLPVKRLKNAVIFSEKFIRNFMKIKNERIKK